MCNVLQKIVKHCAAEQRLPSICSSKVLPCVYTEIYQDDHCIHIPAVPSMSEKQMSFKDKKSLQHMPTISSNNL